MMLFIPLSQSQEYYEKAKKWETEICVTFVSSCKPGEGSRLLGPEQKLNKKTLCSDQI